MKDINNELVSVIMPTYNRAKTIERAINSILKQTYKNLELIIIDDCSNDNTIDIINSIKDSRIRMIKLNENKGANYARNCGLNLAKGEYITFQDSDDESILNRIEKLLSFCKYNKCDVSFCNVRTVEEKGYSILIKKQIKRNELLNKLLWGNFISLEAIIGNRKVFELEKFDEKLPRFQDWDLMIRIVQRYKVEHLNESLVDVFVQNDSITKNNKKGIIALQMILKKYAKLFTNKQIAKIYCRIGMFCSRDKENSDDWFKKAIKCDFKFKYYFLYIINKTRLIVPFYNFRLQLLKLKNRFMK